LLKSSNGFTRLWPSVGVAAGYLAALALLATSLKSLPVGPVYAVWAGLGTAGAAAVGVLAYRERMPPAAWAGVGLVIAGVVLLSLYGPHDD
jgi:small multidrug resistance pump